MKHLLITQEDADKAGGYMDFDNCIVATALKRKFPNTEVSVSGFSFIVGATRYRIINHAAPLRKFYDLKDRTKFKPFIVKYTRP